MRVLVTGGRGLLGEAVVTELVARGHVVTSFQRTSAGQRRGVVEILGDISDARRVAEAMRDMEGVVHLAAHVAMAGPWSVFERVNIEGTHHVLDAAAASGVQRIVHVSSPSVAHTGTALAGATAEPADPVHTEGNYARSKALAEQLVLAQAPADMAVAVVRPHLVWGPGDAQLVGPIVARARKGRLVLIDHGRALVDTLYVDNAGPAIAQALERAHLTEVDRRPLVVTNAEPRTLAELVEGICRAAGSAGPRRSVPYPVARVAGYGVEQAWRMLRRTDDPPVTRFLAEQLATAHWFDQRATQAALDWRPSVSIDDGLRRLTAWYQRA
mgnify:CR=1 FL=1